MRVDLGPEAAALDVVGRLLFRHPVISGGQAIADFRKLAVDLFCPGSIYRAIDLALRADTPPRRTVAVLILENGERDKLVEYRGTAKCSRSDSYCKETGRRTSLRRLAYNVKRGLWHTRPGGLGGSDPLLRGELDRRDVVERFMRAYFARPRGHRTDRDAGSVVLGL